MSESEICVICREDVKYCNIKYPFCKCRIYFHLGCFMQVYRTTGCPYCRQYIDVGIYARASIIFLLICQLLEAWSFTFFTAPDFGTYIILLSSGIWLLISLSILGLSLVTIQSIGISRRFGISINTYLTQTRRNQILIRVLILVIIYIFSNYRSILIELVVGFVVILGSIEAYCIGY